MFLAPVGYEYCARNRDEAVYKREKLLDDGYYGGSFPLAYFSRGKRQGLFNK
jgi:hypothetical protein